MMKNRNKLILGAIVLVLTCINSFNLNGQNSVTALAVTQLTNDEIHIANEDDRFFYELKGNTETKSHLFIWSIKGKLLKKEILPPFKNSIKIDIRDLPAGEVLLELWTGTNRMVESITIN